MAVELAEFDGLDGWCEKRGVKDDSVIFGPNPGKAVSHCGRNDRVGLRVEMNVKDG